MFTVIIDSAFNSTSKMFVGINDAIRYYNANKGEGFNVQLLAPNGDLLEASKTW